MTELEKSHILEKLSRLKKKKKKGLLSEAAAHGFLVDFFFFLRFKEIYQYRNNSRRCHVPWRVVMSFLLLSVNNLTIACPQGKKYAHTRCRAASREGAIFFFVTVAVVFLSRLHSSE